MDVMPIYGTRPEAIKMAPLILGLKNTPGIQVSTVVTGQHRAILDQVNQVFGIIPDEDLQIMTDRQTLDTVTVRTIDRLQPVFDRHHPAAVLVQGDTTSAMAAALAAFYRRIPVVHIEAGLRSGDLFNPFPEEGNRRIIGQIASLHLAPTRHAKDNLLASGLPQDSIAVTGNTVIDALFTVLTQQPVFADPAVTAAVTSDRPLILVTAHRRENHGEPMRHIGAAIRELSTRFPDYIFVLPAHPNPAVRETLLTTLGQSPHVVITTPLSFPEMVHLMNRSRFVLTDSGGIQEEAPALGKPVLILRDTTERPEAVAAGTSRLIGTDQDDIVTAATELITNTSSYQRMAQTVSPYGDGHATERSIAAIQHLMGHGTRQPDFQPEPPSQTPRAHRNRKSPLSRGDTARCKT